MCPNLHRISFLIKTIFRPQNSELAIACEVSNDEKDEEEGHCDGDVYLMNNFTRSALLDAVRGRRHWDLEPHMVTGAVAREGGIVQPDWETNLKSF